MCPIWLSDPSMLTVSCLKSFLLILAFLLALLKAAVFLIVGATWLSISGLSRRVNALEKVAIAAGLGLALVIIAGSATLLVGLPFNYSNAVFLILTALTFILLPLVRPRLVLSRPNLRSLRESWLPVGLFCFHVVLWIIYFQVYPYFPNSDAIDAVWHSEITNQVLQGSIGGPIAAAGLPAGSHILFAFVSQFLGLDVLPSLRITAAAVESLSVLVACCLFRRLFSSRMMADYATVAFALLIPSGFIYYAKIGAYPNIVGDFFVLTSLLFAVIVMEKATRRLILSAAMIQAVALFSHISVVIYGAMVILFTLVIWKQYRAKLRAYFVSNLGFFVFPIAALVFASRIVAVEFSYTSTLYLDLSNDLGLVFQQWVHNYVLFAGPLGFLLVIIATIWVRIRLRKRLWPLFLTGWFTLLFLMVFVSSNDWRLALLSMVPGAGLLGLLLSRLQETIDKSFTSHLTNLRISKRAPGVLMLLVVLIIAMQGPTAFVVNQDLASGQALFQSHIYDSMNWIRIHTPANASVLSVGLQEYRYLPVITNRTYDGDFSLNSEGIMKLLTEFKPSFVAVSTRYIGLNSFYESNNLRAVYQNPDVIVFAFIK